MDLIHQIEAWEQKFQDNKSLETFQEGAAIYAKHGRNDRLKIKFAKCLAPSFKEWDFLRYGLEKLKPLARLRANQAQPRKAPVKPAPRAKTQASAPVDQAPEITIPKGLSLEALYDKNQRLGTKRSLLSNELQIDGGEEVVRLRNCEILDELEPVMAEMKKTETKIQAMEKGTATEEPQLVATVVSRASESYKLEDLYGLELEELTKLRKRLSDDHKKAQTRSTTAKKENTKTNNLKKAEIKKKEINLVNKIITEKSAL